MGKWAYTLFLFGFAVVCGQPNAHADDRLMAVVIRGSGFSPDTFLPSYADYLGRTLDEKARDKIIANIRNQYRGDGFYPPQIKLNSQPGLNGIVAVSIQEPRVVGVRLQGRKYVDDVELLKTRLTLLKSIQPLSAVAFISWVAETRTHTGLYVEGELVSRSAQPHYFDAEITLQPRRWSASLGVNNEGADWIGRNLVDGKISISGIGPSNLELRLRAVSSRDAGELQYQSIQARQAWRRSQWRLGHSNSSVDIEDVVGTFDYTRIHERKRVWLGFRQELARSQNLLFKAGITLAQSDYRREVESLSIREEQIRKISLLTSLFYRSNETVMHRTWLKITRGENNFDDFGSDAVVPQEDYAVLEVDYHYRYLMRHQGQLEFEIALQAAADSLPLEERFRVGGTNIVGALEPSTISGDEGASARAAWVSRAFGSQDSFRFYTTLDYGRAWREGENTESRYASSSALGLRFQNKSWRSYLEFASVLEASQQLDEVQPGDTRFIFSLEFSF